MASGPGITLARLSRESWQGTMVRRFFPTARDRGCGLFRSASWERGSPLVARLSPLGLTMRMQSSLAACKAASRFGSGVSGLSGFAGRGSRGKLGSCGSARGRSFFAYDVVRDHPRAPDTHTERGFPAVALTALHAHACQIGSRLSGDRRSGAAAAGKVLAVWNPDGKSSTFDPSAAVMQGETLPDFQRAWRKREIEGGREGWGLSFHPSRPPAMPGDSMAGVVSGIRRRRVRGSPRRGTWIPWLRLRGPRAAIPREPGAWQRPRCRARHPPWLARFSPRASGAP